MYRSYFSSYQSRDTTRQKNNNGGLLREHRLYQTDFLLRGYGFRLHDLVFDRDGRLPLSVDPKSAYARMNPQLFPVDINTADEDLLLKVPGIGPVSAKRIITLRKEKSFQCIKDLKISGAVLSRLGSYVEFSGKKDKMNNYVQGYLFEQEPETGWCTGYEPYQKDKIISNGITYDYPGQKRKPLIFCTKGEPVFCR